MNAPTTTVHPMTGPAPVLTVLDLTDGDQPIPMPDYGRRLGDLPTRGAVMHALRAQVERIEVIGPTYHSHAERCRMAMVLISQVMEDAEPGLGGRLLKALNAA